VTITRDQTRDAEQLSNPATPRPHMPVFAIPGETRAIRSRDTVALKDFLIVLPATRARPAHREKVVPSLVRDGGIFCSNFIENALFCSLLNCQPQRQLDAAASSVYKDLSDAIRLLPLSNGGGTASQYGQRPFPALHRAC
jgi:hypothetical protein